MARRSLFSKPLMLLISRLHFYVGLLVGPFILVAALSGIAYVISPALEAWVYQDALQGTQQGDVQPLSAQIAAAQDYLDSASPDAVRPAPEPGDTTRIMFSDPVLGPSQHNAVFVDPVTLNITGEAKVYGTSGILPLRTQIDLFHRQLLLGDTGRLYSELAASWLWVMALGGIVLWLNRRHALKAKQGPRRLAKRHATLGVVLTAGLLLFSATGLTWSQWAGGNIAELRHAWGWNTPSVSTDLAAGDTTPQDEHAEHRGHAQTANTQAPAVYLITFDHALHAARQAGLEADRLQITPPASPDQAWRVAEIDRRWPTQVDEVALHPRTMAVIDRTDFATFPLAAKLTRWGIDLHMGVLFGTINQLVLGVLAAGIVVLVVWGYTLWWRRVSRSSGHRFPTVSEPWALLPPGTKLGLVGVALALGMALPVLGVSLALFACIDALRWAAIKRRQSMCIRPNTPR